jgi:hypothetical protein
MTTNPPEERTTRPKRGVMEWLLDSDPSIRWQVLRDLTGEPEEAAAAERRRVGSEGWGARLLALQSPEGEWGDGIHAPRWQSTLGALVLLRDMGLDPASEQARKMVELVRHKGHLGARIRQFSVFRG